ncbi:DUF935 domain-containing protein [Escherichia coli]|uniref:DUF935 domain-containing protein n=1 Tax=Escherichia coli TaxID=562 RepID=UPI002033D4C5|nr:DUF935 domain-containing protein [Escherichia coli]
MSEIRDKFGLSEPEKGAKILTPTAQMTNPLPAMNREQTALNRSQPDVLDMMVDEAMNDGSVPAMRSPVRCLSWQRNLTALNLFLLACGASERT